MAQLQIDSNAPGRSKKYSRKTLWIDMTPMVVLGFLLVTFFVFTTTMTEPASVSLNMPKDGPPTAAAQSKTLSLLLGKNEKAIAYEGLFDEAAQQKRMVNTGFDRQTGFGKLINMKQKKMDAVRPGEREQLIVLIKPMPNASYGSLINTLDEMIIHGVSRYAVVKPGENEMQLMKEIN
jgi:biopolymer transport protein ExbD